MIRIVMKVLLFAAAILLTRMSAHAQVSDWKTLNDEAIALYRGEKYDRAMILAEKALAVAEKNVGPSHLDVAASLDNLADIYYSQIKYAQAEPLYKRSLAIREKKLGPDHTDVAESLNSLAALCYSQGKYAQAEMLHKRSLAIYEKVLGPDHPDVAESLDDLADLYRCQDKYAQAAPLIKRSLAIREKAFGLDHPDVAKSMVTLAGIYLSQGNIVQVEPLLKRSLAISEKALGPDHPDAALSLSGLADLYSFQNRDDKAVTFYMRSLAIREKSLGSDHPRLAATLNHIAGFYHTHSMNSEAEPLNKRALAIYEKAFGPDHPDVALTLNNLACVYFNQERYSEAEPLFDRSLEIREKVLGPNHPDVATTLENLAILYRLTDRVVLAEKLDKRAAKILAVSVIPEVHATRDDITESQVKSFLNDWATAQSAGFYSDYETMYAKRFYGKQRSSHMAYEFNHDTWLKEKRDAFRWKMTVTTSAPEIRISNKTATVKFEETMEADGDVIKGLKLIQIINEGGKIKITREEMLFSREVPEQGVRKGISPRAAKEEICVGSPKGKKPLLTSQFTSLRFQDCSTKLPPPVAAYFSDMKLDILHCPGPKDWNLFIRNEGSFEISHGRSIWSTASNLWCDFGAMSCVFGTEKAEWRMTKSGEPTALIFRVYSQDKKQFERIMSPKTERVEERTEYQSRLVVIKFRNNVASLCKPYARTNQEARDMADKPSACATILSKELLPELTSRKAGKKPNRR